MRADPNRAAATRYFSGDEQAALPSTGISWAELAEGYRRQAQ